MMLFDTPRPAEAVPPDCGTMLAGSEVPVKAKVEATQSADELNLGRSQSGDRKREFEFVFSGECKPPSNVPVHLGVFRGTDKDLASEATEVSEPEVDGNTVRVTLTVHRSSADAGEYTGAIRVGNSQMGSATTDLTIKHQAALWPWPLIFGIGAVVGGVVVAGARWLWTPRGGTTGGGTTGSATGSTTGGGTTETGWNRLWGPTKRFFTSGNWWAAAVGVGAGLAAFNATYISDPTWSLTLSSAFALLGAVGGATFIASFAAWSAPRGTTGSVQK